MKLEGWRITWLLTSILILVIAMLLFQGAHEEAIRFVLRITARTSLVLFLLAFSASSLAQLFDSRATRWLLRNRRYVGVSFAASHFVHLALIVTLNQLYPGPFFRAQPPAVIAVSTVSYLFIIAMAATSSDRAQARLGKRRWKILHTSGAYVIWGMFAYSYLPWAFHDVYYVLCSLLVASALVLRIAARLMAKQGSLAT